MNCVVALDQLLPVAKNMALEMAQVDGALLKRLKSVIDDGLQLPLDKALELEIVRGNEHNSTISADFAEKSRGAVMARGRANKLTDKLIGELSVAWTKTYDGAEPIRVNKWLAQAGVCSRREAEALIESGAVLINGMRVEDVGRKIAPGETLTLARPRRGRAGRGGQCRHQQAGRDRVGAARARQTPAGAPAASGRQWSATASCPARRPACPRSAGSTRTATAS